MATRDRTDSCEHKTHCIVRRFVRGRQEEKLKVKWKTCSHFFHMLSFATFTRTTWTTLLVTEFRFIGAERYYRCTVYNETDVWPRKIKKVKISIVQQYIFNFNFCSMFYFYVISFYLYYSNILHVLFFFFYKIFSNSHLTRFITRLALVINFELFYTSWILQTTNVF